MTKAANLPQATQPWVNPDGTPSQAFRLWAIPFAALNFGPFVQAASDAAAATAGVPVNGVYQNPTTGALYGRRT
jgi:hypothetical protein